MTTADNSIQRRNGLLVAARKAGLDVVTVQSAEMGPDQGGHADIGDPDPLPEPEGDDVRQRQHGSGAAAAVGRSGRGRQVKVFGFDNISAIRPLLASGAVTATADQHGDELAAFGIEYALQALAGSRDFPDPMTPVDLINGSAPAERG